MIIDWSVFILAVNYKFDFYGLIVENTFTTLPDIARELFSSIPGINFIPDFCIKNQVIYNNKYNFTI